MLRKVGVSADGSVSIEELKMVTRTRKRVMRRPRRPINHSAWVGMAKVTKEIITNKPRNGRVRPRSSKIISTCWCIIVEDEGGEMSPDVDLKPCAGVVEAVVKQNLVILGQLLQHDVIALECHST